MSFSSDIKEGLCRLRGRCGNCADACMAGIFEFAGRKNGGEVRFTTENETVADYVLECLYDGFTEPVRYVKSDRLCRFFLDADGGITRRISGWEKKASSCCKRAYIRGAFLGGGSVTDPKNAYHLEFCTRSADEADRLRALLAENGIGAKVTSRKDVYTVYIKESDAIADTLGLMGAPGGGLELFSVQVERELRNKINRRVNCETANSDKTARAASRQIAAVRRIKDAGKWSALPETLQEIGALREKYPDANLKELGELADPPIGKSGVNHRLERIIKFAENV